MEQATFVGGMPKVITPKEADKKAQEIAARLEEWKKRTLEVKK